MNLGAFAVVALIRNEIYSEEIEDYNGLAAQVPALCLCMLICLFSLVGMPPLGGFVGKFMIFAAVYQSAQVHWFMWVVLMVGAINTVFSLFYYLRVLKAMYLAPRPEDAGLVQIPRMVSLYAVAITLPVVLLGFAVVQPISAAAIDVAAVLLRN